MKKSVVALMLSLAATLPASFVFAQATTTPKAPRAPAAAPARAAAAPAAPAAARGAAPAKPPQPSAAAGRAAGQPPCNAQDCPMMHHGFGMMGGGAMGPMADGPGPMMAGGPGEGGAGMMIQHMLDRLGVTDPARKKIEDMLYDAQKRAVGLRADMERAHIEIGHLLEQDNPDVDTVLKQIDKAGQARTELMKVWMKARLEGAKLLSPEQRAQLKQLFHEGMPRGWGGGPDRDRPRR